MSPQRYVETRGHFSVFHSIPVGVESITSYAVSVLEALWDDRPQTALAVFSTDYHYDLGHCSLVRMKPGVQDRFHSATAAQSTATCLPINAVAKA